MVLFHSYLSKTDHKSLLLFQNFFLGKYFRTDSCLIKTFDCVLAKINHQRLIKTINNSYVFLNLNYQIKIAF